MITYVTYREATFKTMSALEAAREQAEAAGWFVSSIDWRTHGGTVMFGLEQEVDSTGAAAARPELPVFEREQGSFDKSFEGARAGMRGGAGAGMRGGAGAAIASLTSHFRRRRPAAPLVPQIRSYPRNGR